MSSLVDDMLQSYASVTRGLDSFSWPSAELARLIEEFILTRDCFFYPANRAPVLEVHFSVSSQHRAEELDVDLHFSWNPPLLDFPALRNVVTESSEFVLTPTFPIHLHSSRNGSSTLPTTVEYFIGPGDNWLHWDASTTSFRGVVPCQIASEIGAERFEAYTVPLELTARAQKCFPGGMRYERIVRCALPVTVKRRPSACACGAEMAASPKIARSAGSHMTREERRTGEGKVATPKVKTAALVRPPLMRSPLARRANAQPRPPPPTPVLHGLEDERAGEEKENARSTEEVYKAIQRKAAENLNPPSPISLNSLSLARLHDALALSHPATSLTDVEVRTARMPKAPEGEGRWMGVGRVRHASGEKAGSSQQSFAMEASFGPAHERHTRNDGTPGQCRATTPCMTRYDGASGAQNRDSETPKKLRTDFLPGTHHKGKRRASPRIGMPSLLRPAASEADDRSCAAMGDGRETPTRRWMGKAGNKRQKTPVTGEPDEEKDTSPGYDVASVQRWMDMLHGHNAVPKRARPCCSCAEEMHQGDAKEAIAGPSRLDAYRRCSTTSDQESVAMDEWQEIIRKNYEEFTEEKGKRWEDELDVMMEDAADSDDEELLSPEESSTL